MMKLNTFLRAVASALLTPLHRVKVGSLPTDADMIRNFPTGHIQSEEVRRYEVVMQAVQAFDRIDAKNRILGDGPRPISVHQILSEMEGRSFRVLNGEFTFNDAVFHSLSQAVLSGYFVLTREGDASYLDHTVEAGVEYSLLVASRDMSMGDMA